MKYDKLNELLGRCYVCGEQEVELELREQFDSQGKLTWRLSDRWFSSAYREDKIVQDLAKELKKLKLSNTFTLTGIDPKGTFHIQTLAVYGYDNPPFYLFKLTPLNSYEKLNRLGKTFK
jgi:hypothetical protein